MRDKCKEVAKQFLGKSPTDAQLQKIEDGLRSHMKALARKDPDTWRSLGAADRLKLATESRIKELKQNTADAKRSAELQAEKQLRAAQDFKAKQRPEITSTHALVDHLSDVQNRVEGTKQDIWGNMKDVMDAFKTNWFSWLENPKMASDFVDAIYGKETGNELAEKAAKAWTEQGKQNLERLRSAGRSVGELDYGYLPQLWDSEKIRTISADEFSGDLVDRMNPAHYLREDGESMTREERIQFLTEAHRTIATNGVFKHDPDTYFRGTKTPKFSHSRQIHLADGDAYRFAMAKYGSGTTLERVRSHVRQIAREIALVEEMGPNYQRTMDYLENIATQADQGVSHPVGRAGILPRDAWDVITGVTDRVTHPTRARFFQNWRNLKTMILFGKILPQQLSDFAGIATSAHFHELPILQTLGKSLKGFSPSFRREAAYHGFGLEHMVADMSAWADENMADNFLGKLARGTLNLGLVHGFARSTDVGQQVAIAGAYTEKVKTAWDSLTDNERRRLSFLGIRKGDWETWRAAAPEDWRGTPMLTPKAIGEIPDERIADLVEERREQAGVAKSNSKEIKRLYDEVRYDGVKSYLGFLDQEGKTAVHKGQNIRSRAFIGKSGGRGDLLREALQGIAFGKSYVYSYMARHYARMLFQPTTLGKVQYGAVLFSTMLVASAAAEQILALARGDDPEPMIGDGSSKFWVGVIGRAGLGIWFDILRAGYESAKHGGDPGDIGFALGPQYGDIVNALRTAYYGAERTGLFGDQAQAEGKRKFGTAAYYSAKGLIPQPGLNLIYTDAAAKHILFNTLQDWLNPGYLARTKMRAQREGLSSWWEADEKMPNRLPDFNTALGAHP